MSQSLDLADAAPARLSDLVGQRGVLDQVRVALDAARHDGRKFDHALLVGPPGCGKSQTARTVAAEMGGGYQEVLGQAILTPADLNALLLGARDNDVLFVDEAHEMEREFQTALFLALDQRRVFLPGGKGGRTPQSIPLADFSLLLATTDEYKLLSPLRDRMRLTTRDVTDFRDYLRRDKGQAVATVNRALVAVRRFFGWLADRGHVPTNPATGVKELRRVALAPKGLPRDRVRKLLREVELRGDVRAGAAFSLMLYTGCRVGDLVALTLDDLIIGERGGSVVFRHGKGNKQRSVPLPLPARTAIRAYLDTRPPVEVNAVFIGERGPLTDRGVRALCDKYSALIGVDLHPHLFRHTMAHRFLQDTGNDLVALAQILGHESLNTTARYAQRSEGQLADASDRMTY